MSQSCDFNGSIFSYFWQCKIEWFHFGCVGLKEQPKGKWYCPDCSGMQKRRKGKWVEACPPCIIQEKESVQLYSEFNLSFLMCIMLTSNKSSTFGLVMHLDYDYEYASSHLICGLLCSKGCIWKLEGFSTEKGSKNGNICFLAGHDLLTSLIDLVEFE